MRREDGAADRQSKTRAARAAFVAAAMELCEKPLKISRRKAWACVINADSQKGVLESCRKDYPGSRRRVFDDVLQQIGKYLEHQRAIHTHGRQVRWDVNFDRMLEQARAQPLQRRVHEILDHHPIEPQGEL